MTSAQIKVTKMGSIVSHRIDYNGIRVLRGQRAAAHTRRTLTQVPPPGVAARKCGRFLPLTVLFVNAYEPNPVIIFVSEIPGSLCGRIWRRRRDWLQGAEYIYASHLSLGRYVSLVF